MSLHREFALAAIVVGSLSPPGWSEDFGRPATPADIKLWDIDVRPDGQGLPDGSGTVAHGKEVYQQNCEVCHGANGVGGIYDRLAGGQGTLATDRPIKTIGSYWPYATTLFDYIHRAMPFPAPGSLSNDDTYAVVAYLLSLNGILPTDGKVDRQTLPKIAMPNRDGFIPDDVFKIDNER
jgi:S-disulfanyl-L-cysteine oxidoreductase SoxD